uniref:Uncharacterized protein n=1 Tax=Arundo donax TaxID=35708 RepID=A0A0A9BPA5_ARUDO
MIAIVLSTFCTYHML